MALQYAVATRNARLAAIETEVGTSATLEIRTGTPPADCAAADTGSVLCTVTLPSDLWAAPSGASMAKAGTWQGTASGTGTAGHFRIKAGGTTTKVQGTCGLGSGDMPLDNTSIASGQTVTIGTFTINEANG